MLTVNTIEEVAGFRRHSCELPQSLTKPNKQAVGLEDEPKYLGVLLAGINRSDGPATSLWWRTRALPIATGAQGMCHQFRKQTGA